MCAQESRPGTASEAAGNPDSLRVISSVCVSDGSSHAADQFRGAYAVLVQGKSVRRHLYFNLPAATRAVERARLRGDRAELVLVRLVPVDGRHLDLEGVDE